MTDAISGTVRQFIVSYARRQDFEDGDDIFADGFVNSLFAMQLVLFCETEFGITVANEDLEMDNFRSVKAITAFVMRKCAQY